MGQEKLVKIKPAQLFQGNKTLPAQGVIPPNQFSTKQKSS